MQFAEYLPSRYAVEELLACRDGGETYRVQDTGLRNSLAVVKAQALSEGEVPRFIEFASGLAAVRHANVAAPYTFGTIEESGAPEFGYTVREYITGQPLSAISVPLSVDGVLRVATQINSALRALHDQGIYHQDLKPENVVVRRAASDTIDEFAQCTLIDLSYRPQSVDGVAALSEVTLQFVAPELLSGAEPSATTDLYALGAVLYWASSGVLPFVGDSVGEILRAQRDREYADLVEARSDLPRSFVTLVDRLLQPNPSLRPSSADEVGAELGEIGGPVATTPVLFSGFVGRDREIAECLAVLEPDDGALGGTVVDVHGGSGSGVSTQLREIQDRLEARGYCVLTAVPSMKSGKSLREQLSEPVDRLVRLASPEISPGRAPGSSTTDLLDDIFVAARTSRVVLIVDDWHLSESAELTFFEHLARLDRIGADDPSGGTGRCQLVLGRTGSRPVGSSDGVVGELATTIRLKPWGSDDLQELLRLSDCDSRYSLAEQETILTAANGQPRAVVQILESLNVNAAEHPESLETRINSSITVSSGRQGERTETASIREVPGFHALVALRLWGAWMPRSLWLCLLARCGAGETLDDYIEQEADEVGLVETDFDTSH